MNETPREALIQRLRARAGEKRDRAERLRSARSYELFVDPGSLASTASADAALLSEAADALEASPVHSVEAARRACLKCSEAAGVASDPMRHVSHGLYEPCPRDSATAEPHAAERARPKLHPEREKLIDDLLQLSQERRIECEKAEAALQESEQARRQLPRRTFLLQTPSHEERGIAPVETHYRCLYTQVKPCREIYTDQDFWCGFCSETNLIPVQEATAEPLAPILIEPQKSLELTADQLARVFSDLKAGSEQLEVWCSLSDEDRHTIYSLLVDEVTSLHAALAESEQARQQLRGELDGRKWQPIATAPSNTEVLFWVRPLTAVETYRDTSGNPILAKAKPHLHRGKRGSWGALWTASHWMPTHDPAPPAEDLSYRCDFPHCHGHQTPEGICPPAAVVEP